MHPQVVSEDGTIGQWREDALAVLDEVTSGPQVVVGSSMGLDRLPHGGCETETHSGHRRYRPGCGLHTSIALAAPRCGRTPVDRGGGRAVAASVYDDGPYPITKTLIEDGKRHLDGVAHLF